MAVAITRAIAILGSVIPRKTSLPILRAVCVTERGGRRIATATDLENWIEVEVDMEPGLYEIVGKELVPSKMALANYPVTPTVKLKLAMSVWLEAASIDRILSCVSRNETRYTLNGIAVIRDVAEMALVGTDGTRLWVERMTNTSKLPNGTYLIPVGAAELVAKHAPKGKGFTVTFTDTEEGYIGLAVQDAVILARKITGRFPNYEAVTPKEYIGQCSFSRDEMLEALKQIKAFLNARSGAFGLRIRDDVAILRAENEDGHYKVSEVAITTEKPVTALYTSRRHLLQAGPIGVLMPYRLGGARDGDRLGTGFNHKMFYDFIRKMPGDRIYFGYKNAESSVSFSTAKFVADAEVKGAAAVKKPVSKVPAWVPTVEAEPYAYLRSVSYSR